MAGVTLKPEFAQDVKKVTDQVLNGGGIELLGGGGFPRRRGARFYKAPAGGIAAPADSTTPSSTSCKLMRFNAAGTALEETNTFETVLSFSAYAADSIFQAQQVGGRIIADAASVGGESGTTVEAAGTLINTHGLNSFSSTNNQTKQISIGDVKVTDTNVFGSGPTVIGGSLKKAGTYQVKIELDVTTNATSHGNVGTLDTGVPEDPTRDVHLTRTPGLRFRLYLHDSANAGNTGTLVDEHQIGFEFVVMIDDQNELDGSDNEFQINRQYHLTIKRTFGLSQATIDALTGNEARVYLECLFERAANTFGTADATVLACYDCTYLNSEFESGDLIDVTAASPP